MSAPERLYTLSELRELDTAWRLWNEVSHWSDKDAKARVAEQFMGVRVKLGVIPPVRPNDGRSGRCGKRLSGDCWCLLDEGHEGDCYA